MEQMCCKKKRDHDQDGRTHVPALRCLFTRLEPLAHETGFFVITVFFFLTEVQSTLEASLVAQSVKNLPAVQETQVQALDWEDPLVKEMANHSSILAWKIPWTEKPGGLQSMGLQELDTTQ